MAKSGAVHYAWFLISHYSHAIIIMPWLGLSPSHQYLVTCMRILQSREVLVETKACLQTAAEWEELDPAF